MSDSLVLAGIVELLGGGVASTHPQAEGAYFRLGLAHDMSSPQMTSEQTAGLLLDGEVVTGWRASNRTPTLPITILVPATGDAAADRLTLAGARELVLQLASQDHWELTWTREGSGLPLIFDCMGLTATTIDYSILRAKCLISTLELQFQALPYGRSDVQEVLQFNAPGQQWQAPPTNVLLDDFQSTPANFLQGNDTNFDVAIGNWVAAGNCAIVRTTAQVHSGAGAMQLTSSAAGAMQAASCLAALVEDTQTQTGLGIKVNPGDTVNLKAFSRAATLARSVNIGADFYDSQGNVVGSTLRGSNATNSTTVFTTSVTAAVVTPQGASYARANCQVLATAAAGEVHYFDDISMDRGTVYSYDDSYQWSKSGACPVASQSSARWTRSWRDFPVYDHTMPAPLDITGRTKFAFWFGLATNSSQYPVWHKGKVAFAVTLYDASGASLSFGHKRHSKASAIESKPHWNFISAPIPQMASGFDYTTVSRYVIEAWNYWDSGKVNPATGRLGQPVLQSGAFIANVQATPTTLRAAGTRALFTELPGVVGSARSAIAVQVAPGPSAFQTVTEFTALGSNNFTAPAGLSFIDVVEIWAPGGGGAGSNGANGGGGGGGGEYVKDLKVPVTALGVYVAFNGTPGAAGAGGGHQGNDATDSTFTGNSGATTRGHGGHGGWQSTAWGGGKGGSGSTAYAHFPGGNGQQANANLDDHGGGGGGSGGQAAGGRDAGDSGNGREGATAVQGGGPGGDGGHAGSLPEVGASPSVGPGGGGGGGSSDGSGQAGAAGKAGKIRLSYGASGLLPLQSVLLHMPQPTAPDALSPVCGVGNGADTPNGATEYLVPQIGILQPRFDGSYSLMLVVGTWSSPASSRTITVQVRQYPYSGGTAATLNISRTITPNVDLVSGGAGTLQYVDLGPVTLPLNDLPPGSTDAYFAVTVTSTITADRYLDLLLLDTQGSTVLVDVGSSTIYNNVWLDQPSSSRNLGRILGSDADKDRAFSLTQYASKMSGGPLAVYPDMNNRILLYSAQGAVSASASYPPEWYTERLS
jgi:hypothetical protein